MAKFYGAIGFNPETIETAPGVYTEDIVVKYYAGDLLRNSRRLQSADSINSVNDDIVISNEISIVADEYAYMHFQSIRYVEFMGAKWKVTNVEVQHPRLLLTLGGVYND